jgi:hypothetical protein
MVRAFIEMLLGEWGRQLLYFYEANACIINSFVLTYGVLMFISWTNLVRTYRFLVAEMAKQVHTSEDLNRKSSNKRVRDSVTIPWEKAIEISPFPFISGMSGLLPKRMTVENLQEMLDEKDLADKAIRALKGEHIKRMAPSIRLMQKRELERKQDELRREMEEEKGVNKE